MNVLNVLNDHAEDRKRGLHIVDSRRWARVRIMIHRHGRHLVHLFIRINETHFFSSTECVLQHAL